MTTDNGNKTIAILMATYNGERFIGEQIDSLLSQTYTCWHLYVHDDGSNDATRTIVKDYASSFPEKISLLQYPPQGGACQNFISLLERVDAEYYMFCDQDDVWLPEKIALSIDTMLMKEKQNVGKPIIVSADLYVADENLNVIHPSRSKYSALYPQYIRCFDDCAPTAGVTGCTMLFNRVAKDCCIYPVPSIAMHDRWLCLCTLKAEGKLYWIDKSLIYYRQHGGNCLGAGSIDVASIGLLYRVRNLRRVISRHIEHYSLLRRLGYGSVLKYIKHVLKYRKRIKEGRY